MAVEIQKTPVGAGSLDHFLNVVDYIYRDTPNYVRPLNLDLKQRVSLKNPFFDHAEGVIFTAHRNGRCLGRASAQIDREHLKLHDDGAGFFGFFDTIDDREVAKTLLDAAGAWLKERGMKRMRGPFSFGINEEIGCLVEGFDTPPMVLMPHHQPYQGGLIEGAGLARCKDLYAWRYTVGDVPKRAQKAHDEIAALPEIRGRHADMSKYEQEIRTVVEIFNDAWSDHWCFVPFGERELKKLGDDLKLLVIPELITVAEIDGEPAAVALALPNVNELIHDLGGRLGPTGIAKVLYRLKVRGPKTARLILLGIRKKYRHVKKYAGLSTYLYVRMNKAGQRCGIKWGELSWTLEDNAPVNVAIKFMGGKVYKRYRIYEREL
jgi:hypothetical protein